MVPKWPNAISPAFAIPAISLIALAACSSGSPSAEEIVTRSREAMSQLTSYQWSSTHNTVGDGRFGARPVIEQWTETGAARDDGRYLSEQTFNAGTDGEGSTTFIAIGDTSIWHFDDGSIYEFPHDDPQDRFNPAGSLEGDNWDFVRSTSLDGRDIYVLTRSLPRRLHEETIWPTETSSQWTVYVDENTYLVVRRSIESETVEQLPHGPGPREIHTRRTINTFLSAFNEPVDIEFPEGFEPGGSR